MFLFDASALPQLTTRKAFIGVDFQHDFCDPGGLLLATEPAGFVDRATKLADAVRASGDIIWVKSKPDGRRPPDPEQIILSDDPAASMVAHRRTQRGQQMAVRGSMTHLDSQEQPDEEAFLSRSDPSCLNSPAGLGLCSSVKASMQRTDLTVTKTHYSAFRDTQLLLILRAKMVMEVFICGSLANIGLYATALDAARHGLTITVVEDCCGYRSKARQTIALQKLVATTGCEIASAYSIINSLQTHPKKQTISRQMSRPDKPSKENENDNQLPPPVKLSVARDVGKQQMGATLATDSAEERDTHNQTDVGSIMTLKPLDTAATEAGTPSSGTEADNQTATTRSEPADAPGPLRPSTEKPAAEEYSDKDLASLMGHLEIKTEPNRTAETVLTTDPKRTQRHNANRPSVPPKDGGGSDETSMQLQDGICEGDTHVIENVLPKELEAGIFDRLRQEISWQRMSHQGGEVPRLVAVQGEIAEDGSIPIYRHPSDEAPPLLSFSPTVLAIKNVTERRVGHPLNHVLIQFYRDGNDYISEHSDKTLDIVKDSYIANVSLGAERVMVLRTKRLDKDPSRTEPLPDNRNHKRQIQRARLPHNSLFRMGLSTNTKWLHAIRQDKRSEREKTTDELAYSGRRISLTFRYIGTFLSKDQRLIWGQGATRKTRDDAQPVINGQSAEAVQMLRAFGIENHASNFDWVATYGKGFDVLHMSNSPRFFASSDPVVNLRISLMLAEYGISYAKGSMSSVKNDTETDTANTPVRFIDNDASRSLIEGEAAIMLYLEAVYGLKKTQSLGQASIAKKYTRFQQALNLLKTVRLQIRPGKDEEYDAKLVKQELGLWNAFFKESDNKYLVDSSPCLSDFVFWPVLHSLFEQYGSKIFEDAEPLECYYKRIKTRESVEKILAKNIETGGGLSA